MKKRIEKEAPKWKKKAIVHNGPGAYRIHQAGCWTLVRLLVVGVRSLWTAVRVPHLGPGDWDLSPSALHVIIIKHGFPWIPPTHQKSPKWGALEVIFGAFWSQVVNFRGKKVLLENWWKNESKKRPQSEKTKLLETMGRGCVALKETPEATGQRPETTGQTP